MLDMVSYLALPLPLPADLASLYQKEQLLKAEFKAKAGFQQKK